MIGGITLIAAIGRRGQLGLNGEMPWGRSYPEDLKRFQTVTAGGVVIVGRKTWPSVQHLDGTYGRSFLEDDHFTSIFDVSGRITLVDSSRPLFIAGGARTYQRWLPIITRFDVTGLPYDGPADVVAPFLLPHLTRTL